jgi:hypothetical protein
MLPTLLLVTDLHHSRSCCCVLLLEARVLVTIKPCHVPRYDLQRLVLLLLLPVLLLNPTHNHKHSSAVVLLRLTKPSSLMSTRVYSVRVILGTCRSASYNIFKVLTESLAFTSIQPQLQ